MCASTFSLLPASARDDARGKVHTCVWVMGIAVCRNTLKIARRGSFVEGTGKKIKAEHQHYY